MTQSESNKVSFFNIIKTLVNYFNLIVLVSLSFTIFSIIYVQFFTESIYISDAKIMSSSKNSFSSALGIAAQFGINLPSSSNSDNNWPYGDILRSRDLAKSIIKNKFTTKRFGFDKSLIQILTYGNSEPIYSIDTLEAIAVKKLLKMIQMSENKRTGIFTLKLGSFDPKFSSELLNIIIQELDNHQRAYNKKKTNETKLFIRDRIIDTEKLLRKAEEALRDFRHQNRRIENSPNLQLEQERIAREVVVLTGVFTTLKQQIETLKIEEVKDSGYVIIVDEPQIPLVRSKPNKKLIVILFTFIGLGFGIIISFVLQLVTNFPKDEKEKYYGIFSLLINNVKSFKLL